MDNIFTQRELEIIELALKTWIDTYYKKGSQAWGEKMELLQKVRKLSNPEYIEEKLEYYGKSK